MHEKDIAFKTIADKKLSFAFLPPTKKVYEKAPVYFIICGGGWEVMSSHGMIEFSKKSVDILRDNGFAVVSPEYRVIADENVGITDCITDCFDALRYISKNAQELGIDNKKISLSGHSAGGHLSLMLGYANSGLFKDENSIDGDYVIKAVAPMSPVTILYDGEYPVSHHLENMAGRFKDKNTLEERKNASPIYHVSKDVPPTILFAGTSDWLVYSNSSEILYDKLIESGAKKCELVLSGFGGHCFEKIHKCFEPTVKMDEIQNKIADFVLQYGV